MDRVLETVKQEAGAGRVKVYRLPRLWIKQNDLLICPSDFRDTDQAARDEVAQQAARDEVAQRIIDGFDPSPRDQFTREFFETLWGWMREHRPAEMRAIAELAPLGQVRQGDQVAQIVINAMGR